MEHDSEGGLPIDISILADLALKCRAYAKALHYKEREHRMGGASSCVEALISINRKLDLQGTLGLLNFGHSYVVFVVVRTFVAIVQSLIFFYPTPQQKLHLVS